MALVAKSLENEGFSHDLTTLVTINFIFSLVKDTYFKHIVKIFIFVLFL